MINKSLSWQPTPILDIPKNVGWSEDAKLKNGETVYKMYYDNNKKLMCVEDIREDVIYEIPSGAKSKGYVLAFKLNSKY